MKNSLQTMFIAVLMVACSIPAMGAKLPASKTAEQQILEDMKIEEQSRSNKTSLSDRDITEDQILPEDNTKRYQLSKITFKGNTLLTDEQLLANIPDIYNTNQIGLCDFTGLKAIAKSPGITQEVSVQTMEGFRNYIISIYNKNDYSVKVGLARDALETGGALEQGILPFVIFEGLITSVTSTYSDPNFQPAEKMYLNPDYLLKWSPIQQGKPYRIKATQDYINLLNLNSDRYVTGKPLPGDQLNTRAFKYEVLEANPWHYFIQVDNSGTDDTQWRPQFILNNSNLLGYDDKLTAVYQVTPDTTWDETYAIFGSYDFPILGPKLRLTIYGGYNEFNIPDPAVGSFFGAGRSVGGILRYNALQFDDWFWDLKGSISYEESEVSNELFAAFPQFNLGTDINMTLWGLGTELYKNNYKKSDRSNTSLGFMTYGLLDSSDPAEMRATRNGGASDDFQIYQFSGRHSRYLDADKIKRLSSSVRVIYANDRLVPAKMTSFGGMYTIRGYEESDTVADGGLIFQMQYEYDLVRAEDAELSRQNVEKNPRKQELKKLAPLVFFDYGQAWIEDPAGSEDEDTEFASVGCGIITELGDNFKGTVYYGHPLVSTNKTNTDDGRVHVGILLRW